MGSEDWSVVTYEEAEGDDLVTLSPDFTASALVDALHDSPLRSANATRCSPGTHVQPKQDISAWLAKHSPQNNHRADQRSPTRFNLLWLHGTTGTGKTTIMQTLADALLPPLTVTSESLSSDHNPVPPTYESTEFGTAGVQYAGTALFLSREHELNSAAKIFSTIAFSLATRLPPLSAFIQSAFDASKHLFQQTVGRTLLKEQAEALIFKPIQAWVVAEGDVDVDFIILVDGLDECDDEKMHADIIGAVRDVFTRKIPGVWWSWVFSSRTNEGLREVFVGESAAASPKAQEVVVEFADDAEMDVFLDYRFAEIRRTHPVFHAPENASQSHESNSSAHVTSTEEDWPSPHDKAIIKWQVVGLYAAASSIMDYIADPHDDPRSRIVLVDNIIGNKDPGIPGSDHPYTKLDKLYKEILAQVPPRSVTLTRRILGAISCLQPSTQDQKPPTIAHIIKLFDVTAEMVNQSLCHLQSVISVPSKTSLHTRAVSPRRLQFEVFNDQRLNDVLKFLHPSFDQFLRTPSRSGEWGLNLEAVHLDLARCCLNRLASGCSGPLRKYMQDRWYIHCWRTGKNSEAALGILPDLFEFDYSTLQDRPVVDRYFVEWLLYLQETTMSEYQLLNSGPLVTLRTSMLPESITTPHDEDFKPEVGASSSTSSQKKKKKEKESPPRPSYILGIETSKQVYLVPFYDIKVQKRADVGQVVVPGLKHWDWIRGFMVIPRHTSEGDELQAAIEASMAQITVSDERATASASHDEDEDEGLYV